MIMATRRPVVYLIAQPTVSRTKQPIDLSGLYEHGDVQVLCPLGDSPTHRPRECMAVMESRFEPFDPDVDFLVWAGGDTMSAVLVGMLLAERDIYEFTYLRYERKRLDDGSRTDVGAKYVPIEISVCDLDSAEGERYAPEPLVAGLSKERAYARRKQRAS
jgi:hypothetical protein